MERLHATCISLDGRGLLITGPSGCGKSDLALRLIEAGARLVADDQVEVQIEADGTLLARCPAPIRGLIEARYIGPLPAPHLPDSRLDAALAPPPPAGLERLPEPATLVVLGQPLPLLHLPYLEASVPAKLRLWLQTLPLASGRE